MKYVKAVVAVIMTVMMLTTGVGVNTEPASADRGDILANQYIVVEVDPASCSAVGWSRTCGVDRATIHGTHVDVTYIVYADLPIWKNAGPFVKNARIDWCPAQGQIPRGNCDYVVQSQGYQGWVQNNGVPVVIDMPPFYNVDMSTGAWSTEDGNGNVISSGVLPSRPDRP